MSEPRSYTVAEGDAGKRLDVFLAAQLGDELSRTKVKECIKEGAVLIAGMPVTTAHYHVAEGEAVSISYELPAEFQAQPEQIPLRIVFEDAHLIVVDKPAGMVVHPGAGAKKGTLVNALVYHFKKLSRVGGTVRPGIVHRIDKDTSGLLVIAKTDKAHMNLAEQFKEHTNTRKYYALVKGVVQHDEGRCDAAIGKGKVFRKKMVVEAAQGRHAVTYFRVLERFAHATALELTLETGRTHQIRVHMAHIGHPILGDKTYGVTSRYIARQALHAQTLGFEHPATGEWCEFTVPVPDDIKNLIDSLRNEA